MAKKTTKHVDVYQMVTDTIIEALEKGAIPWHKPWKSGGTTAPAAGWPRNASTGRGYSGINVLLLWLAADANNYTDERWLTYKQAVALGGSVRKGEKGARITFWKTYKKEVDGEEKDIWFLKYFTVFNVQQCQDLELPSFEQSGGVVPQEVTLTRVQGLVDATGATILHGGDRACFSPVLDRIRMPKLERFESENAYWGTLLHELTHWTGHESRLGRTFGTTMRSHDYAREELVAEIGSAFLCAQVGVPLDGLQHPAYLESWLKVLREDKRAIISAASKARKASELILSFEDNLELEQVA